MPKPAHFTGLSADEHTVEELRELIAVPPKIEYALRAFARAHPEEAHFIEKNLKFRLECLNEFERLVRDGIRTALCPFIFASQRIMLDTGAPRTTVSPELADVGGSKVMDATHRGLRLTTTAVVEVAGNYFSGLRVAVADMKQLTNMQVDGLLGQDVLREFSAVRIDYKNHMLELEQ